MTKETWSHGSINVIEQALGKYKKHLSRNYEFQLEMALKGEVGMATFWFVGSLVCFKCIRSLIERKKREGIRSALTQASD